MSKIAQANPGLETPTNATAEQITRTARASVEAPVNAAADQVTRTARASETTAKAARQFTRTATAIVEDRQAAARDVVASEAGDVGRTAAELLTEQTRHNVDAVAAIARAVNWADLAQTQREFFVGSFDRMRQFNERYREAMLSSIKSMGVLARR